MMGTQWFVAAFAAAALMSGLNAQTPSWPQWRGPNRDGAAISFTEPAAWPQRLTERWKVQVGVGHSSPVLLGNRVYIHTRVEDREVLYALDSDTGRIVWQEGYRAPYQVNPAAAAHGPGPKSTPAIANGSIYALGISGVLSAHDASTGRLKWRTPASANLPLYGTAMSPVVDGTTVIAHVGGDAGGALTAFDGESGAVKWRWSGDGPGYASPVIADIGGTRQVITQSQSYVISVSAASGALLWKIPFTTNYTQNAVTPVVHRDLVIYSGLDKPITAVRPVRRGGAWTAEPVWNNPQISLYMSSPVIAGSALFGLSHRNKGQFFGLDLESGKTYWVTEGREAENTALVRAGGLLFLLNDDADLIVARPSMVKFEPLRHYQVANSPTWAHPAIVGNRIIVKDASHLTAWTVN
jgi:outer membrane protein assembly factor BamB